MGVYEDIRHVRVPETGVARLATNDPARTAQAGLRAEPPDVTSPAVVSPVAHLDQPESPSFTSGSVRHLRTERDAVYRRSLAIADLFAALGAVSLALVLGPGRPAFELLATAPLIVLIGKILGTYEREELLIRKSTLDDAPALFQLATFFALIVWFIYGLQLIGASDRRMLLVLWIGLVGLLLTFRTVARLTASRLTPSERVLVIGDESTCNWLRQTFARRRALHATVVARVDPAQLEKVRDADQLAEDIRGLTSDFRVERALVTSGRTPDEPTMNLIRIVTGLGLKLSVLPRILEVIGSAAAFDEVDGLPLLSTQSARFSRSSRVLKRTIDLAGSALVLSFLSPVLVIVAVAIKVDSAGPVFFAQDRVGRNGRRFRMLKFRTMGLDADEQKAHVLHLNEARGLFKIHNDPRCTRVGRWLRRMSLDELPQLFNVVRGEMSLVGPRPLVVDEDQRIEGWHRRRLQLTPGMTGHWQILGSARIPLEEMVRIDYLYVTNWSLWLDVKILLRTVPYVLSGRGM